MNNKQGTSRRDGEKKQSGLAAHCLGARPRVPWPAMEETQALQPSGLGKQLRTVSSLLREQQENLETFQA